MDDEITKREFIIKNIRVKEDETLSEGRKSISSSKSPSRIQTTWEDKYEDKDDQKDDEVEFLLQARRRQIKETFAQVSFFHAMYNRYRLFISKSFKKKKKKNKKNEDNED